MKSIFRDGIIIKDFVLKNISSFKTGGKAKYYFIPGTKESLNLLLKNSNLESYIIGNGTNILVSDNGFNGILISLKGFTNYIWRRGNLVFSGAAVSLNNLINFAIENNLGGIEKLSGIPGTVGGAVYMNAGAFGKEIGDYVQYVKVLSFSGKEKIFYRSQINFSYRSATPLNEYIILECGLKLHYENREKLLKTKEQIIKERAHKQPLEYPSAGSVFKRGAGYYAGELIEQAGCKGLRIGGAMVSEKHSNFIINAGNASSSDIYNLIKEIQKRVYNKFKIKLEPEIKFLGKFD